MGAAEPHRHKRLFRRQDFEQCPAGNRPFRNAHLRIGSGDESNFGAGFCANRIRDEVTQMRLPRRRAHEIACRLTQNRLKCFVQFHLVGLDQACDGWFGIKTFEGDQSAGDSFQLAFRKCEIEPAHVLAELSSADDRCLPDPHR